MFKDITGTEVKVGDKVAFKSRRSKYTSALRLGYVDKLCPKTIGVFERYVTHENQDGTKEQLKVGYTYVFPDALVVVERDGRRMLDERRKREEKRGVTESFIINLNGDSKVRSE